jgi:hypothetical protein
VYLYENGAAVVEAELDQVSHSVSCLVVTVRSYDHGALLVQEVEVTGGYSAPRLTTPHAKLAAPKFHFLMLWASFRGPYGGCRHGPVLDDIVTRVGWRDLLDQPVGNRPAWHFRHGYARWPLRSTACCGSGIVVEHSRYPTLGGLAFDVPCGHCRARRPANATSAAQAGNSGGRGCGVPSAVGVWGVAS